MRSPDERKAAACALPGGWRSHSGVRLERGRSDRFLRAAVLLALSLLISSLLGSCRPVGPRRVLRLAHGLDTSHPVHVAMEHMASRVDELSEGALRIRIYPAEQLGSERECLELLQIGSLAMTKVSASVLESFAPAFGVFGVPYLFDDRGHLFRALDGEVGRDLLLEPISVRLRGLGFYDAGARSFYTRDSPVLAPADLAGLKIRTQESPSAIRMVRTLGGSATPISWGELYSALQQGVVDGAENNPPSFHLSRHYEVAKSYALDEHTSPPDVLLISAAVWSSLSEAEAALLDRAVGESEELQKELWERATAEALAEVERAGVRVHRVDKSAFQERVRELQDEYRSGHLAPFIERIVALRRDA